MHGRVVPGALSRMGRCPVLSTGIRVSPHWFPSSWNMTGMRQAYQPPQSGVTSFVGPVEDGPSVSHLLREPPHSSDPICCVVTLTLHPTLEALFPPFPLPRPALWLISPSSYHWLRKEDLGRLSQEGSSPLLQFFHGKLLPVKHTLFAAPLGLFKLMVWPVLLVPDDRQGCRHSGI